MISSELSGHLPSAQPAHLSPTLDHHFPPLFLLTCRKSSKYKTPSVPFPFDSKDTYERAMRQPLGREYNTGALGLNKELFEDAALLAPSWAGA